MPEATPVPPSPAVVTPPVVTPAAAPPVKTDTFLEPVKTEPAKTEPVKAEEPAKVEEKKEPGTIVAPEVELALPTDANFVLDQAQVDAFKATAKDLGLDSAKAQRVFDQYVGIQKAQVAAEEAAFEKQNAEWHTAVMSDPTLGEAGVTSARRALTQMKGGKELAELLSRAGLGKSPVVIRAFAELGRSLKEDSVSGAVAPSTPPADQPLEVLMYPTMHKR